MTPFSHLPGDILSGLDHARSFARGCGGPVSVLIAVPQRPGLPAYTVRRTFWCDDTESSIRVTYPRLVCTNRLITGGRS